MSLAFLMILSLLQDLEPEINQENGIAIKGYDAVSYFKSQKSTKGIQEWSFEWKNVNWLFSSQENLISFSKDPQKYAPQYGGYCAWGMRQGYKADTDPENSWTIVDDKLYFNYNKQVLEGWLPEKEENIKIANGAWKSFRHK